MINNIGRCFELSGKFIMNNPEWKLIHAVITDRVFGTGSSITHAWCEKDGIVYDPVLEEEFPAIAYYGLYGVVDYKYNDYEKKNSIPESLKIQYDYKEAIEIMLQTENYGPWDQKIIEYEDVIGNKKATIDR